MHQTKSEILEVVRETAKGLHDAGAIDQEAMREIDRLCRTPIEPPVPHESAPIDHE